MCLPRFLGLLLAGLFYSSLCLAQSGVSWFPQPYSVGSVYYGSPESLGLASTYNSGSDCLAATVAAINVSQASRGYGACTVARHWASGVEIGGRYRKTVYQELSCPITDQPVARGSVSCRSSLFTCPPGTEWSESSARCLCPDGLEPVRDSCSACTAGEVSKVSVPLAWTSAPDPSSDDSIVSSGASWFGKQACLKGCGVRITGITSVYMHPDRPLVDGRYLVYADYSTISDGSSCNQDTVFPEPQPPAPEPQPPASEPQPPASEPQPPASEPQPPASDPGSGGSGGTGGGGGGTGSNTGGSGGQTGGGGGGGGVGDTGGTGGGSTGTGGGGGGGGGGSGGGSGGGTGGNGSGSGSGTGGSNGSGDASGSGSGGSSGGSTGGSTGSGGGTSGEGGSLCTPGAACTVRVDESGTPTTGGDALGTSGLDAAADRRDGLLDSIRSRDDKDTGWGVTPTWFSSSSSCDPWRFGDFLGQPVVIDYCPAIPYAQGAANVIWLIGTFFAVLAMVARTVGAGAK